MAALCVVKPIALILVVLSSLLWCREMGEAALEHPSYEVIHKANGYEIRRYVSSVWMTTLPIQNISFTDATNNGFSQLFNYIQGANNKKLKIEMTAPVLTQVTPSDGPFCKSTFVVSFYVPKANQANPPSAYGLHAQTWKNQYVAAHRFGGFASDSNIALEAAALQSSLQVSAWYPKIAKSRANSTTYIVAQYNSPYDFNNRVNEILLTFDE